MDVYKMLQEILDIHPAGAPASKYFDEILKILFTEEEAELAVHMKFSPMETADIAEKADRPVKESSLLLDGMVKKAIIFSRKKKGKNFYTLLPVFPALFKFPFIKGGGTNIHGKLGDLWKKYYKECFNESFACSKTPHIRVIPVQSALNSKSYAHPHEDIKQVIGSSDFISLTKCGCRVSMDKCNAADELCIMLGDTGRFLVEQGFAREISMEEALALLMKAEKDGLFHTCNNSKNEVTSICNCCSCCCYVLRGETELDRPDSFATSAWLPIWNPILCAHCENCADNRCPVNAIRVIGNFVDIEEDFCIGCGLCVSECPENALTLARRIQKPEIPENIWEMEKSILKEKGKLDRYNEHMEK